MALALTLCLTLACAISPAFGEEAASEETELDMFKIFSESKLDLEPHRGKAIFINFFTEWCPNCVAEMPDIKRAFDTYSRDDLEIILVHVWHGEDASNSENVRNTFGLHDMNFFEDEDMGLATMLGVPGYPTSLFIDGEGNYAGAVVGGLDFEGLSKILDEMGVPKAEAETGAEAQETEALEEAAPEAETQEAVAP